MLWLFFLFGLASLTGQVLLLREILAIFHGTEISIGIFYGAWLSGIGIGAFVGALVVKRSDIDFQKAFIYSILGLGFSILIEIVLMRNVPRIFGIAPAELAPLHGVAAAVPVGTLLVSFLTGFLFPVGCKSITNANDNVIARLYVFEALGSLAAGLLFTFILARLFPPVGIATLILLAIASGVFSYGHRIRSRQYVVAALSALSCGFILLTSLGMMLSDWSIGARWRALHPGLELLTHKPTPYQQAEIARLGKQFSFFGNSKIVSTFPDPHTTDKLAGLIMAQRPNAKKILIIGGATGSLLRSFLAYPLQRFDVMEADQWAFKLVREYLPPAEAKALDDSRVRIIFGDGRLYVNRMGKEGYDIIVSLIPDPVSAFWNRYYTKEFFRAAANGLAPGGVLVTGVTSSENFWGSEVASYAGSVYYTLKDVFPSVMATPGDETLFFATTQPGTLTLDPDKLAQQYGKIGVEVFNPAAFQTMLPPKRTKFVHTELKRSPVLINTDFTPISSSLAMILWGKFSGTAGLEILNTVRLAGLMLYVIPLVFFLVARVLFRIRWGDREGRETRFQASFAMAAVGACAMGLQIVLMYSYQSLFGYVFERVGLFAALFMAGLAGGGLSARFVLDKIQGRPIPLVPLMLALAAICLAVHPTLRLLAHAAPWVTESVMFAGVLFSGALTGVVFPLAASAHFRVTNSAGQTSGWIDAADHFGSAIGGMITGTLLVPLLGMYKACMVLALVVSLPVVFILTNKAVANLDHLLKQMRPHGPYSFPYVGASWFLMWSVAAALVWNVTIGPPVKSHMINFDDATLKRVSGSGSFTLKDKPWTHYVGSSDDTTRKTFTLSTIPPAGHVRGYGGPINLLVSVTDRGAIKGLKLVESDETPSYIQGLEQWLGKFKGHSILDNPGKGIDAITSATITCQAVKETLQVTGRKIANPILGIEPQAGTPEAESSWKNALKDLRLWMCVCVLAFAVVAFHSRNRIFRWISLGISLVIIGFYLNAPFTSLDVATLIQLHFPAVDTPWRVVLLVGILVMSVLWGQVFCGYMCPFGALQELLAFKPLRQRASEPVERFGRYAKFVILAALICVFLVTGDKIWFSFSPLQSFFKLRIDSWILALSLIVLGASVIYFRFWCRYLCPAGAFFALFNKISLLRSTAPKPIPARCDLGISFPGDVDCIRCHRCLHKKASEEGVST